jgi:hypothetical protein
MSHEFRQEVLNSAVCPEGVTTSIKRNIESTTVSYTLLYVKQRGKYLHHGPYKFNYHQSLFHLPTYLFLFFQLQQAPFCLYWGWKHENRKQVCG